MAESSPLIVRFLDEYERLTEKVSRCLRDYLGQPGTTQTQGLRASVRRLDAAIKVLPRRTRKSKGLKRCHERCRDLLRETSRIRDIDIIAARVAERSSDPTVSLILSNLKEEREEFVDNSTKAAWNLLEHHPPKIGRRDIPRFARRVETVLQELDAEITSELHACVTDETKVEELHSLRKDCKRLRYTLELLPSLGQRAPLIGLLRSWQDVLGEIRDIDVIVDYLSKAKQTRAVRSIIAAERAHRHARYVAFVEACRKEPRTMALSLLAPSPTR